MERSWRPLWFFTSHICPYNCLLWSPGRPSWKRSRWKGSNCWKIGWHFPITLLWRTPRIPIFLRSSVAQNWSLEKRSFLFHRFLWETVFGCHPIGTRSMMTHEKSSHCAFPLYPIYAFWTDWLMDNALCCSKGTWAQQTALWTQCRGPSSSGHF